jgi:class 3 adenylate cyclase/tetratricopeptide (TPR) repeat protein
MVQAEDRPPSLNPGKRCHVTLLFSDLCDYTALSENADPEVVAEVLHVTKSVAASIIEKHGGTLNQFYGDGLLAVFGLPQASEDDARRAAEAALELHEALRARSFDLELPARFSARMHTGIHSGLVFARSSDARDGHYEIVGDPITTAARLCSAASPDEILASEAALSGVAALFEVEALPPLRLKGKLEPLSTYRLLRRAGFATRFEARAARGLTPFVGRGAELAQLVAALDDVRRGAWRLVHLTGDVGVGKTRLLDELAKRLDGSVGFYTGGCESYGHATPLQPFLQIIEQAFGLQRGLSAEAVRRQLAIAAQAAGVAQQTRDLELLLGLAPQSAMDPEELAARDALAVTRVVEALARERPACLVLDDWHAADDASYRLLARLASALAESPRRVLIIALGRTLDRGDPLAALGEHIELGPLDEHDTARALGALLPNPLEVGIAENIGARSGGNPLFLEELCQAWPLAARDADSGPPSQRVPSSLHGLIQTRLERLPPELLRLARAAAVIGTDIEAWLLESIAPEDDVGDGLLRLVSSALVHTTDRPGVFRFKHGVTREVVYDSVRIGERRRLHGAIADAIEARFAGDDERLHCEALAHHHAGAGRASRAARYAELAGDKATQSSSLDRARLHYRAALDELDKLSSSGSQRALWVEVSRKWAAACVYSPAPEQIEALERALRHTEELAEPASIALSHYWLGWIHYGLGDQERALSHTRQALALAERSVQPRLSAQLYANLGQIQLAAADAEGALVSLERAVASKHQHAQRAARASVPVGFAYAVGCQGAAHAWLGDFAGAYDSLRAALGMIEGSGNAIEGSLLGLLAMAQVWRGHHAEAVATTERMRATAERVGGPYVLAMSRTIGSFARWQHEHSPAALEQLATAADWIERREMRLFHSFSLALVAEAFASAERYDVAERYALRALERAEQLDRLGELSARRVLARCRMRDERRAHEVDTLLEDARAIALARRSARERWLVELAWAECARAPSRDERRALADAARRELEALGVRLPPI